MHRNNQHSHRRTNQPTHASAQTRTGFTHTHSLSTPLNPAAHPRAAPFRKAGSDKHSRKQHHGPPETRPENPAYTKPRTRPESSCAPRGVPEPDSHNQRTQRTLHPQHATAHRNQEDPNPNPTRDITPTNPGGAPGGDRDRTDDPLLAKQVLSQLSYTPKSIGPNPMGQDPNGPRSMGQGGFEPPTPRLSSVCSNQLSY